MTHHHSDHLAVLLDRAADQLQVSPAPTQRILAARRRAHRRQNATQFALAAVAVVIVIATATVTIWSGDGGRAVPAGPATTAQSPQTIDTQLDGTWLVIALAGSEPTPSALSGYFEGRVLLKFDDGRMTGQTGCNAIGASYEQSGDLGQDITFIGGSFSEVACPEGEPPLLDKLGTVRHVSGAGSSRYLLAEDDQVVFELQRR
jgi:heat shock protein HslJ